MTFLEQFAEPFGYRGFIVALLVAIFFVIQFYFYVCRYWRVSRYRNKTAGIQSGKGVSVVVILKNDPDYLEKTLPVMMRQDHPLFEIVAVCMGSDNGFRDAIDAAEVLYPNKLNVTRMNQDNRLDINNKVAYNLGIKVARYDNIIFTTADTEPTCDRWLSRMAAGFDGDNVVIGYCGIEPREGFFNSIIRSSRLMMSVRYLASAVRGRPYRGIINNLGLTKGLYFGSKGFNHLNMNFGEDDLYIQSIARKENTSVVLCPECTVREKFWGNMKSWISMRSLSGYAYAHYPARVKAGVATELLSRTALLAAVIAAIAILPPVYKLAAAGALALRYAIILHVLNRICRRVGEKGLTGALFVYDIIAPFCELVMWFKRKTGKDKRIWR